MEPFRLSEPPAPKVEKSEKDDDSTSKKKRERAARHLHLVESPRDKAGAAETSKKPDSKKEDAPSEPTSLGELFEVKAAKSTPDKPEQVVDDTGKLTEEGNQASVSVLAEKSLEQAPSVEASKNMTPEEKGEATGRAFLELAAESGDIEGSAAQIQSEIGVTDQEAAAAEAEIPSSLPQPELVDDDESAELPEEIVAEKGLENEAGVPDINYEIPDDVVEEDEASPGPTASAASSSSPATTPTASSGASHAGGAGMPPTPGAGGPPLGPNLPPPMGPGGPNGPIGPTGPGVGPNSNPNNPRPQFAMSGNLNTPQPHEAIYDSGNPAVTALIGYLIGRRHGRKRAERRAAKEQRKYERTVKHQIEDIDWQLKAKEAQIRKLATEKARQERDMYVIPRPRPSDKEQAKKVATAERVLAESPEKPSPVEATEQVASRRVAPEANQLHSAKAPERLGHMLVNAAELPLAAVLSETGKNESKRLFETKPAPPQTAEKHTKQLTEKHVETLSRHELLTISEKIVVDGTSLRQIYETHLIGERGLRRLVAEHLQGGDVKKILRREIVEHEIDFERDPAVRDVPTPSGTPAASQTTMAGGKAALNKLVEQASVGFGDGNSQAAYYKARAEYEKNEKVDEKSRRRIVDIGMSAVITTLTIAVILLYLSGR